MPPSSHNSVLVSREVFLYCLTFSHALCLGLDLNRRLREYCPHMNGKEVPFEKI
jgi:hypothetical protein